MTDIIERSVPLDVIRIDGGTQSRTKINTDVVATYAQNMEDGSVFPPATIYFDGKDYWLADGFHRYHANRKNNKQGMVCRINNGTVRDAILHSYGANGLHGLQMTLEDKRHIVLEMLNDFEWGKWSHREIARKCNVSHTFVDRLNQENGNVAKESVKYITPKGNVAERKLKPKKDIPKNDGNVAIFSEPTVAHVTDEHDEKQDTIEHLIEENDKLRDQLAGKLAADPVSATEHIEELRAELKQAQIELAAVIKSRDMYQSECAQLKKQVASYQRQLKKAA